MNKESLRKALEESELISDPETMEELLVDSEKILKAAYPAKVVSPQAVVSMAQTIILFEGGNDDFEEEEEGQE